MGAFELKEENKRGTDEVPKDVDFSELLSYLKTLVMVFIVLTLLTRAIQPTIVSGLSMYPTLYNKDALLINKLSYKFGDPKRGDIIVFETTSKDEKGRDKNYIKRVIGLPGDHVVVDSYVVYLNGERLDENYIDVYTPGNVDMVVPKDSYFVMGDNRGNSLDSRYSELGAIKKETIVGKAIFRLYPLKTIGLL